MHPHATTARRFSIAAQITISEKSIVSLQKKMRLLPSDNRPRKNLDARKLGGQYDPTTGGWQLSSRKAQRQCWLEKGS